MTWRAAGPGHAPGPCRRAARRVRRDGRGADPLRALGQHHRAPRLLDGAVRRGRRAGHAGRAHPGPSRVDARRGGRRARRGAAARRPVDPQRPLPGRNAPSRRDADLAAVRRRRAARVRRQPRPPRRHRRADRGRHARRLHPPRGGGRGDPADAGHRRRPGGLRAADAQPAPAARRPARPARREPRRRAPHARADRPPRPGALSRRDRGDPRLRGAAHPGRSRPPAGRRATRPRTCSRTTCAGRTWRCGLPP